MQAPNYGYFAWRAFLESTGNYAVWGLYHTDLSCSQDCPLIILCGTSSLSRARASCLGKCRLESGRSFFSNRRVLRIHFVLNAIAELRLLRAANVPLRTTLTWSLNFDSGEARTCLCEVRDTRESCLGQRSGRMRKGNAGEFSGRVYVS